MNELMSSSLVRVLAAPWQQRRNAGGLGGVALVVALCLLAPVALSAWSLLCDPAEVAHLRHVAQLSAWCGVGALLAAGWAMLVGNVLQQNHPTPARLVPGHVESLRAALLAAWAILALAAAAGPGIALEAPLAWGCGVAAALALFAAALRWPLLWLAGVAAPLLMSRFLDWDGHDAFVAVLAREWRQSGWTLAAVVAIAGTMVLVALVRSGGKSHAASHDARRSREATWRAGAGGGGVACIVTSRRWGRFAEIATRPYTWWMRRLLARADGPVAPRLLLGLGPATHWTTRLFDFCWAVAVGGALCLVVASLVEPGMRAVMVAWMSFSALIALANPALQAVPRLHRTRGEQALLALLPGVPRGPRLNRWLAWQMTWPCLASMLGALAVSGLLVRLAEAMHPGVTDQVAGMNSFFAVGLLPLAAWQWRRWARMGAPSALATAAPLLVEMLLGALGAWLHWATGTGYLALGAGFALVALLVAAWRWWRMAGEPTAFPIGRLA